MKTGTRWTTQHYNHVVDREKRKARLHVDRKISELCTRLGYPPDMWLRWHAQDQLHALRAGITAHVDHLNRSH